MDANNIIFNYREQLANNKHNLHFLYMEKVSMVMTNFTIFFLFFLRKVYILYHGKAVEAPLESDTVSFLVPSSLL